MPQIARLGDPVNCPGTDTLAEGSGNVFANGLPVVRVLTDYTAGHCHPPVQIVLGSSTVFVNGISVARVGDPNSSPSCSGTPHSGVVSVGSPDVYAG